MCELQHHINRGEKVKETNPDTLSDEPLQDS